MNGRACLTLLPLFFLFGCGDGESGVEAAADAGPENRADAGPTAARDAGPGQPDAGPPAVAVCGDGFLSAGEICDDGNADSGDGCTANCRQVEANHICPTPGRPCQSTVVCGDKKVTGSETCDDGNQAPADGCDAACKLENGWACPFPGLPCEAKRCGDRIRAGLEQCDDGDIGDGDGCSAACRLEQGWVCAADGSCRHTVCGDDKEEGTEACDDGNQTPADGCSPVCEVEPDCSGGACTSSCGDGMILAGDAEECDDGNTADGDGCSASCKVETGFGCEPVQGELPPTLDVPVTYRDFLARPKPGSTRHPDFEHFSGRGVTPGLVGQTLGSDGKPLYTGVCQEGNNLDPGTCPHGAQTTSQQNFDQWYRNAPGVNLTYVRTVQLERQASGAYFLGDGSFYPLDDLGWLADGKEYDYSGHNFGFTSEIRTWFEFKGNESLTFSGDDDVWVFINGKLALDLGGLHSVETGSFVLDATRAAQLGLQQGHVYEIALFHAERHTDASNFNLTLTDFLKARSRCTPDCDDGRVVMGEVCDDGTNDGSYGGCMSGCKARAPYCGDGVEQTDKGEECDDGLNISTYGGCAPGCKDGPYCGDGFVQAPEACDEGTANNTGEYGGCASNCALGPHCGDGIKQEAEGEQCDDGNRINGDLCSNACRKSVIN